MIPNKNNFCGGNFRDWLEVNLTEKCNGRCSWCIEKNGFHPEEHASWWALAGGITRSGKKDIILLGGEPTLFENLSCLIGLLVDRKLNVWITTNGSLLDGDFIRFSLSGIKGINISIHDHDLAGNAEITGIGLKDPEASVKALHGIGASVRFNCNCMKGHIDSLMQTGRYIEWAKRNGADSVRFAELKQDEGNFVDLAKLFGGRFGLNDDPFTLGCNHDAEIDGMKVNFRQMCGLQTPLRVKPVNPEQFRKTVLYYDGIFYDGWQTVKKENNGMEDENIRKILGLVANGTMTKEEAFDKLKAIKESHTVVSSNVFKTREVIREVRVHDDSGSGCQY